MLEIVNHFICMTSNFLFINQKRSMIYLLKILFIFAISPLRFLSIEYRSFMSTYYNLRTL
ncbi:unnamed protein product [Onchocerca flexuosa]|uniref:Uncharacterized protein n=1 Tax=Onchocerca flexuosa TaxID=387005 RepID=A0A183HJG8_9BILA|nr:unnamed protein product [Onchocerca flexuosa]